MWGGVAGVGGLGAHACDITAKLALLCACCGHMGHQQAGQPHPLRARERPLARVPGFSSSSLSLARTHTQTHTD